MFSFHFSLLSLSTLVTDRNNSPNYERQQHGGRQGFGYNQQQQQRNDYSSGQGYQQRNNYFSNQHQQGNQQPRSNYQQQQRGYQSQVRPAASSTSSYSQGNSGSSGGYTQWRSQRGGGNQQQSNSYRGSNQRGGYQRYDSQQPDRYFAPRPDKLPGPPLNQYGGSYSRK